MVSNPKSLCVMVRRENHPTTPNRRSKQYERAVICGQARLGPRPRPEARFSRGEPGNVEVLGEGTSSNLIDCDRSPRPHEGPRDDFN